MKKWTVFPFFVIEDDITQLVLKWLTDWLLPTDIVESITGISSEGATSTNKAV